MKRLTVLLLSLLPLAAAAQKAKDSFDVFYREHVGKSGYMTVEVTSDMLRLLNAGEGREEEWGTIGSIRLVTEKKPAEQFLVRIRQIVAAQGYKLMTTVVEGDRHTAVYFKSSGNPRRSDCITIIAGKENIVVNIVGDFDIEKLSSLSTMKFHPR
ncbi:MAG: DUF4252 domain-containing protein [Rikenellaceae bacterium]|jgi:hypothetical protein|nr:DUF4252 domain-containing protein [Rikenellaceae bacterium]